MPTINVRWSDNTEDLRKNLARGTTQLEATRVSVDKLVKSFQGDNLIAAAHKWAVAIDQIGGITKLTAAEQTRANAVFTKASEKLTLLGKDGTYAGEQFRLLAAQTKGAAQATDIAAQSSQAWTGILRTATGVLGAFGVSLSVGAVVNFGRSLLKTAGDIADLSAATGVSKQALQQLAYVGVGVGVSMDEIGRAVGTLSERLAGGDQSAADAVKRLGLDLNALLKAGPTEAFIQLGEAAGRLVDPMERNAITADLFGAKLSKNLIPILGNLRTEMEAVPKDALISDAQIEAADKFGDAWDRAAIRLKASVFSIIDAFNKFNAVPPIDIEASVARLKAAGVTSGPLFDELAKHRAREAAETEKAMRAAYDYAASLGVVAGAAQGSADVEKIHAAMLAASEAATKKAAEALDAYNAIVKEVTATHDTFAETVDTIDGQIVEGIRYYLERGRSVGELATMYGVLTTQVQAVSEQMKAEAAATKEATSAAEAASKAFVTEVTALNDLAAALRRVEHGNDRMNVDLTKIGEHVDVVAPKVKEATLQFEDLAKAFAQLAQIGGGSFGGIVQGIGTMVGAINVAVTAVKGLNQAIKDGAANAGTYVAAYTSAFGAIGVGFQLLSDWQTAGMKRQDELGRKINALIDAFYAPFQDAQSKAEGGLRLLDEAAAAAGISLDRFHAALNMPTSPAKYLEIVSAINEINAALAEQQRLAGLASKFGPSRADLQKAAVDAKDVLDYMTSLSLDAQGQILANAQFTQDQLNAAYLAWQTAMAAAGDVAAQAWLDAQKGATTGAAAVTSALSAMQKERDDLAKSIEGEAWEPDMGIMERDIRAQMAKLDDEITAAAQGATSAAEAAAADTARIVGSATNDTRVAIDDMVTETADATGQAMSDAAVVVSDAFKNAADQIAVDIGEGTAQVMVETADGIKLVMGDAAFFTAEEFKNAGQAARHSFDKVEIRAGELAQEIEAILGGLGYEIPVTFRVDTSGLEGIGASMPTTVMPGAGGAAEGGIVRSWGIQHFATGGLVGPRGRDTVPAWLSEGEMVLTSKQQQQAFASSGGADHRRVDVHAHLSLDGHEVTSVVVTDVLQDKRGAGTKLRRGLRLTED